MFLLNIEEIERSEITLVKIIHYRQLHQDFLRSLRGVVVKLLAL